MDEAYLGNCRGVYSFIQTNKLSSVFPDCFRHVAIIGQKVGTRREIVDKALRASGAAGVFDHLLHGVGFEAFVGRAEKDHCTDSVGKLSVLAFSCDSRLEFA